MTTDYKAIADLANDLDKGATLEVGTVTNITNFKRALFRLLDGDMFFVYSHKGTTYIRRRGLPKSDA